MYLCSIYMYTIMFTADNANEEQEIYGNEQEQMDGTPQQEQQEEEEEGEVERK